MTWSHADMCVCRHEVPWSVLHTPLVSKRGEGRKAQQHSPHGGCNLMLDQEDSLYINRRHIDADSLNVGALGIKLILPEDLPTEMVSPQPIM